MDGGDVGDEVDPEQSIEDRIAELGAQETAYNAKRKSERADAFIPHPIEDNMKLDVSVIMKDLTAKRKYLVGKKIFSHDVRVKFTDTTFDVLARREGHTDIRETKKTPTEIDSSQCSHEVREGEVMLHFVKKDTTVWPTTFDDITPPPSPGSQ